MMYYAAVMELYINKSGYEGRCNRTQALTVLAVQMNGNLVLPLMQLKLCNYKKYKSAVRIKW